MVSIGLLVTQMFDDPPSAAFLALFLLCFTSVFYPYCLFHWAICRLGTEAFFLIGSLSYVPYSINHYILASGPYLRAISLSIKKSANLPDLKTIWLDSCNIMLFNNYNLLSWIFLFFSRKKSFCAYYHADQYKRTSLISPLRLS